MIHNIKSCTGIPTRCFHFTTEEALAKHLNIFREVRILFEIKVIKFPRKYLEESWREFQRLHLECTSPNFKVRFR
jgi:hypothetical protein